MFEEWSSLTIRNVDTGWNSGSGKGQDVQGGEVRSEKLVLFKLSWPGQLGKQAFSLVHQGLEFGRLFAVDHGHETLEFAAHAHGVPVSFDEPNVRFDCWTLVFDPIPIMKQ